MVPRRRAMTSMLSMAAILVSSVVGFLPTSASTMASVARAPSQPAWHWQFPAPPSLSLPAVSCPGPITCFVAGSRGIVLSTVDGGRTWQTHDLGIGNLLFSIACKTVSVCYTVGNWGAIAATFDGGRTWSNISDGYFARASVGALAVSESNKCGARSPASPLVIIRMYTATHTIRNLAHPPQSLIALDHLPPDLLPPAPGTVVRATLRKTEVTGSGCGGGGGGAPTVSGTGFVK